MKKKLSKETRSAIEYELKTYGKIIGDMPVELLGIELNDLSDSGHDELAEALKELEQLCADTSGKGGELLDRIHRLSGAKNHRTQWYHGMDR